MTRTFTRFVSVGLFSVELIKDKASAACKIVIFIRIFVTEDNVHWTSSTNSNISFGFYALEIGNC